MNKRDILNSMVIALTDEMNYELNMGMADVYLDENKELIMVATGLDAEPQRFLVGVEDAPLPNPGAEKDWLGGTWIQTRLGIPFDLANPRPEAVSIYDISNALSKLCRYTGHVSQFYSVAQHSVLVSVILEDSGADMETVRAGLLHDAAEAYVGDVSSPLKSMLTEFKAIENEISNVIFEALRLDCDAVDWRAVKWADMMALFIERAVLMAELDFAWVDEDLAKEAEMLGITKIPSMLPDDARTHFVERYVEIGQRMPV